MRPKPPPNATATTNSAIVPAAKETVAAGLGPMSLPSAELIGACMAKPAPTASVRAMAVPRSTTPKLQTELSPTPRDDQHPYPAPLTFEGAGQGVRVRDYCGNRQTSALSFVTLTLGKPAK